MSEETFFSKVKYRFQPIPDDGRIDTDTFLNACGEVIPFFGMYLLITYPFEFISPRGRFATVPLDHCCWECGKWTNFYLYFFPDVLGSTAFAPVKSDINGNITVRSYCLFFPSFTTNIRIVSGSQNNLINFWTETKICCLSTYSIFFRNCARSSWRTRRSFRHSKEWSKTKLRQKRRNLKDRRPTHCCGWKGMCTQQVKTPLVFWCLCRSNSTSSSSVLFS